MKARSITILCVSQVLVLTLWFSGSAAIPALSREFHLTALQVSLWTSAVQLGFVVGTLVSAILGLADRLSPKRFFMASGLTAAALNGSILLSDPTGYAAPLLRFATGICMAGVYPVGMRMAATWAKGDMGLMVGLLVGALTIGSASPHLFNALGGIGWRTAMALASVSAAIGAMLIHLFGLGPNRVRAPRFDPAMAWNAWKVRALRLANFGYFGHMWELYAMWAWIGLFLEDSFRSALGDTAPFYARLATFATVGAGGLGCLAAGVIADRIGRTAVTIAALACSGACCLLAGLFFGSPPWLLTAFCMVWGVFVVADSAQFSASIAELSDPAIVGTMLTIQTSVGFLITLGTIHVIPYLRDWWTWQYAFAFLAIGPAAGIWSMLTLRRSGDAMKLAGGRR